MISPEWVRMMARYNQWQNDCMGRAMESLPPEAATQDRGAFFGSILGTANHLIWADMMWLSRLQGGEGPGFTPEEALKQFPTVAAWSAERFRVDGRLKTWAEELRAVDLAGDIRWYSGVMGREMAMPLGQVVTHVFNHQTHHRGQIHVMLTAAGAKTDDTDLIFMPN
jgi:uncharacterized damage-inducible protein DinB